MSALTALTVLSTTFVTRINDVQAKNAPTSKQTIVINTMRNMSNLKWRPTNDISIYGKSYSKNITYNGIPYNQNCDNTTNDFVNACGWAWSTPLQCYQYKSKSGNVGNDCSSAVAIALKKNTSSIQVENINTDTFKKCTKNGTCNDYGLHLVTVGGYATDNDYTTKYSSTDCFRYYKQIQPGDILLHRYIGSDEKVHKHVVLVTEVGTEYVRIIDQIGLDVKKDDVNSSWRHDKKMTYNDLYNSHYLPVREKTVTP